MMKTLRLKRVDRQAFGPSSKRLHGALFSLSVTPLPAPRRSSFACVVSKQIAAKASRRNLVKRRCREVVRARLKSFPAKRPFALVFRAKNSAAEATFAEIDCDIRSLIDKIAGTGYNLPQ